jgi:8-oxo-dGTP diphosphatase
VGNDRERPLTRAGRDQADAMASALAEHPITRIVSSPYVRCMETMEPLATKLGLTVHAVAALAEEQPIAEAIELLSILPDNSVACTHGDILPGVVDRLALRGMIIEGDPDWRKGVTWVLDRDCDEFVRGRVIPPPT